MAAAKRTQTAQFGVPGLGKKDAGMVIEILQDRLNALNDLALTLKHVHWNVVGPQFIGVHEMLDPQVVAVRGLVDEIAERIATLGASPQGTPDAMVKERTWDDYSIGRDTAMAHLGAVDLVYTGVIEDHRNRSDDRKTRPGHPGHAHRARRRARAVPVVCPRPSGGPQRVSGHHGHQDREAGRGAHAQEVGRVQRPGSQAGR